MARGRPRKETVAARRLTDALDFISLVHNKQHTNEAYKNHCVFWNKYLLAFDGVLSIGHPIDEEFIACPHTKTLIDAVSTAKKDLMITAIKLNDEEAVANHLQIKADRFQVRVPCISLNDVPPIMPDTERGELTATLVSGFNVIGGLARENADTMIEASIFITKNSMFATDRKMALQYWHGQDLPDLVVPKQFVSLVGRIDKQIVGFGYSQSTFTVHFKDGSWVKTQLYVETWPDIEDIIQRHKAETNVVLSLIWEGLEALAPFDDIVIFDGERLVTENENASYDCRIAIADAIGLNIKSLLFLKNKITDIAFRPHQSMCYFVGDNLRGVLLGIDLKKLKPIETPIAEAQEGHVPMKASEEVPF